MSEEPLIECTYGWGRILRLYTDYLNIDGAFYDLNDLLYVQPDYRRMLGVCSARLTFQFREQSVTIRGIADVSIAHKIVAYLATWSEVTIALAINDINEARLLTAPSSTTGEFYKQSFAGKHKQQGYTLTNKHQRSNREEFERTYVHGEIDCDTQTRRSFTSKQRKIDTVVLDAVPSWPWLNERYGQRMHRLKHLQAERERRLYGFDIEELALRLQNEPLPHVSVPIRLLPGEIAHYRSEAALCAEPPTEERRQNYHLVDRGELILSNRRIIYLGRKRQLILSLERLVQVTQVAQAIALFAEYWARRQYILLSRPLECIMYIERILQHYQYFELTPDDPSMSMDPLSDMDTIISTGKQPAIQPTNEHAFAFSMASEHI